MPHLIRSPPINLSSHMLSHPGWERSPTTVLQLKMLALKHTQPEGNPPPASFQGSSPQEEMALPCTVQKTKLYQVVLACKKSGYCLYTAEQTCCLTKGRWVKAQQVKQLSLTAPCPASFHSSMSPSPLQVARPPQTNTIPDHSQHSTSALGLGSLCHPQTTVASLTATSCRGQCLREQLWASFALGVLGGKRKEGNGKEASFPLSPSNLSLNTWSQNRHRTVLEGDAESGHTGIELFQLWFLPELLSRT